MKNSLIVRLVKRKKKENLFDIVVMRKNIRGYYLEKVGLCYLLDSSLKIIKLNTKRLTYWINKGARINTRVLMLLALSFKFWYLNEGEVKK